MFQADRDARQEALVLCDAATLLHRHGTGGIAVSAVASTLLVWHCARGVPYGNYLSWWLGMSLVLFARGAYLIHWYRFTAEAPDRDGAKELRQFAWGVYATAIAWAVFPLLFFSSLPHSDRSITAVIVAGMAGGSATVLATGRHLALIYNALLLVPGSIRMLLLGGSDNVILGVLGLICFLVLARSAEIGNQVAMQSLRLSRVNQQLLLDKELEHSQVATANAALRSLQFALEDANEGLEQKIKERTEKLVTEIRERERYEQELSRMASTDPLTGLCNRSALTNRIRSALAEATNRKTQVALLFIDLDNFKEVNDVRGHHAGDRVLSIVGERLAQTVPSNEDLARWGGDEFVVILRDVPSAERASEIARAIRESVCQPIDTGGETVWIDGTIGISIFPEHGSSADKLIRAADVAMYAAKQERHQRVRLFDPILAEQVAKGHFLGQCLSEAIANQGLTVVYQPIVSSATGQCVAMEALARWRHPEHGPVPPSEFIPLAERSGDILALGRWILHESCRQAISWAGEQPPVVSVNVSAAQILAGNLVTDVMEALQASGLPRHRLHLELTESAFAGDFDRVAPVLAELRDLGVHVSLDDFGTGFSSLAYLQKLPIDTIKIDRTFVSGMETETRSIVRAIVSLAKALGYNVIAEGVETEAQRAALNAMGVESQQGFLYSRPLVEAKVPEWLAEWRANPTTAYCPDSGLARVGYSAQTLQLTGD